MIELRFGILAFMLLTFSVLEGWDFGAGALHLLVAKTNAERREVIAAIGPLWSWHEVWLIAAGGTFMVAFPRARAMATAFAGYYLALWLVLWSFMLCGISLEVGGHLPDPLWQAFWDLVFAVSNVVLAIVFGAALGNVIRECRWMKPASLPWRCSRTSACAGVSAFWIGTRCPSAWSRSCSCARTARPT